MPEANDVLSAPHLDQVKPTIVLNVGSVLEAESYFKSPYYHDSYYFPFNPDPHCRGNNYKTYDEMRDDDQVKVALSFKKDIVVNAGWHVTCADPQVKEFVTTSLKRMQDDGSLQMSFEDAIRDMLSAYDYGFSAAEPVFKIRDGFYHFDSIRVRPAQSFRFQVGDKGDVTEIIQMTNRGEMHFDPRLFVHHVYQVEWGNPYGKSDLRGAHDAWKAKKFVSKFLAIYLERFAGPTVVAKYPPTWDTNEVAQLQTALKTIQQSTVLTIPESTMIDFVQANKDSSEVYIKALNYYNMHIARALLVPDLLGISGEKTGGGSFALGQDQFKMFLATVEKDRLSLARKITLRLIAPLVKANFGQNIKCDFQFVNYSMDDQTELLKIWADVVKGNVFKPTPDEINYLRKQLKFPEGPVVLGDLNPAPQPGQDGQFQVAAHRDEAAAVRSHSRETVRRDEFQGLPINIEIDRGQEKSGTGPDGRQWSHVYEYPYGEIARTEGEDGDPVDVYLGPNGDSKTVHVVHQKRMDGGFDEDKVMLGFDSPEQAKQAYTDHGPSWGFGSMDSMTVDEFKNGYLASNRKFAIKKRRDFTSAEKKVDFALIEKSLTDAESELSRRLKRTGKQVWQDYAKQVKESNLVGRFDPAKLNDLKPRFLRDMNVVIKQGFADLLEQAYREAQHELFPEKKFALDEGELSYDDMMEVLEAESFNITKDYSGLVSKKVNSRIVQGLKQGRSSDDIMALIRKDMPDLTDSWIDTLVRTKTTEIYNRGRKSYFDNDPLAQKVVEAYQFSAIIDSRTSQICSSLDKKVFRADDGNINLLTPPLHLNCFPAGTIVRGKGKRMRTNIEDVRVGDRVLTQSREFHRVEELHRNHFKGELIVLELENGVILRATPNHPIFTKNRGWVEAGALNESDELEISEVDRYDLLAERKRRHLATKNEELRQLYVGERRGLRAIGAKFGVQSNTVGRWLKELGIPLRHGGEAVATQWNDASDRRKRASERLKAIRAILPHPRLGMKDPAAAERMRLRNPMNMPGVKERAMAKKKGIFRGAGNPMYGRTPVHPKPIAYNGMNLKSTYELGYAQYLERNGVRFSYEPQRFNLGFCTYVPDFFLLDEAGRLKEVVEIKGWVKEKDRAKIDALRKLLAPHGVPVVMYAQTELKAMGAI